MLALAIALFFAPPLSGDMTKPVTRYAEVTLHWEKNALTVLRITRGELPKPTILRRWRGRFEARALDGAKTLEFVRFDFPLLAAAESSDEMGAETAAFGKKLRDGVSATTVVRVPLPDGATSASIYDTQTRKSVPIALSPSPAAPRGAGENTKR